MSKPISRSQFLKYLGGAAVTVASGTVVYEWMHQKSKFPCRLLGPSRDVGHKLRARQTAGLSHTGAQVQTDQQTDVVIVGGGIAGLSAGWWLQKQGLKNFRVLELEAEPGGNSSSGKNEYSAYPWGAHYVPVPNKETVYVRQLFEELGIITGHDDKGRPLYNELYVCHDPQERLFKDGSFQEGLVPKRGVHNSDREQIARFFKFITTARESLGSDGKPAFCIPVDLSSQTSEFVELDKISMRQWLIRNDYDSHPLLWYLNYCCKDDYGSTLENVSAWAGIHYFAGRRGTAANTEQNAVITWPEGNGFLVHELKKKLEKQITTNALVASVRNVKATESDAGCHVTYLDTQSGVERTVQCKKVIFAGPRFVASHIIDGVKKSKSMQYAPWMVANISVKEIPQGKGADPSWDNVSYYSESLGYVVANHQEITTRAKPGVLTYYFALSGEEPVTARNALLQAKCEDWSQKIVRDLEGMHPGIAADILGMDLWPWGHGMARPSPGVIWGDERKKMKEPVGNIYFAHSDMSGLSNFEEANYHGVQAAMAVLNKLEPAGSPCKT